MPYVRIGKYSIEVVHQDVIDFRNGFLPESYKFDGYQVNLLSTRYHMFIKKGITCVSCGLRGSYYALERTVNHRAYKEWLERDFNDFL